VESFEETQKENEKRLSRLEYRKNTDENEDIELEQVRNLNSKPNHYFSHF